MWVRNRVLEVTRLNDRSRWFYVSSRNNVADLGTRKGAKIEHVGPDSPWIQGQPWMQGLEENVPLKSVNELALSVKEKSEADQEKVLPNISAAQVRCLASKYPYEVGERYEFSNYLLSSNKFRFSTIVRMALVFLFIQKVNVKDKPFNFLKKITAVQPRAKVAKK